ncbi:hypothetical protein NC651_020856 [Populus alba x Populus x berolinensis]|nr:hypothetical protein NC651_020856 [Populus alba x Populus x berolinensis]
MRKDNKHSLPEYVDVMVSCLFHFVQVIFQWCVATESWRLWFLQDDVTYGIRLRNMTGMKTFVKAEPYEAAKRRRSSKGIENSMELAPDVPSVCVDVFTFYAVPEGELGASDVPAGEAAGEAPVQYNDESASDQNENFETVQ